jgi:hypothetical protein
VKTAAEPAALLCEAVEMGSLDRIVAIAAQMVLPESVRYYENDIHGAASLFTAALDKGRCL